MLEFVFFRDLESWNPGPLLTGSGPFVLVLNGVAHRLVVHRLQEACRCCRKRLLRHVHVMLAQLQRLDDQTGGALQILERHSAGVLAGDGDTLEVGHEIVLVQR